MLKYIVIGLCSLCMGCELAGPSALSLRQQAEMRFTIANNSATSGHLDAAIVHYEQALRIAMKHSGKNNPALIQYSYVLGAAYEKARRPFLAISILKYSLKLQMGFASRSSINLAKTYRRLGLAYLQLGKYRQATRLLQRGVDIYEKTIGKETHEYAHALSSLGNVFFLNQELPQAEKNYSDAIAIYKRVLRKNPPFLARIAANYATLLEDFANIKIDQKEFDEAIELLSFALKVRNQLRDFKLITTSADANAYAMALAFIGQKKYAKAELKLKRYMKKTEALLGKKNSHYINAMGALGSVYAKTHRMDEALSIFRKSAPLFRASLIVSADQRFQLASVIPKELGFKFTGHIRSLLSAAKIRPEKRQSYMEEAFAVAQSKFRVAAQDATALANFGSRFAHGNQDLAALVRNYQDIANERAKLEHDWLNLINTPHHLRDITKEVAISEDLAEIKSRSKVLSTTLLRDFPDYARFILSDYISPDEVKSYLKPDEAIVFYLNASSDVPAEKDNETYVAVVRDNMIEVISIDITLDELKLAVARLRQSLDIPDAHFVSNLPKFDVIASHELYKKIFKPVEPFLVGVNSIFVIPHGPLKSLPFSVLVQESPKNLDTENYASVSWLAKKFALTTLPSVASLKVLRKYLTGQHGSEPFIGFGDPVIEGPVSTYRGLRLSYKDTKNKNDVADLNTIRSLPKLPETADEIRALNHSLKGAPYNTFLGARATESAVKNTELSKYRIIAFATHGLLANEIGNPEAALVMSPPEKPSFYDDGLLTASEIRNLSLNANLVILSACNTASSETTLGTDGVSSLSNAFFYAGARALLISHWRVDSTAAVHLTTNMIQYAVENPNEGYNTALKYSILNLMNDEKNSHFSHPTFWAPFVLVGEGGRPALGLGG